MIFLETVDWISGREDIWKAVIAIVTPGIVYLIGKIPPLPRWVLPSITPLVGLGLGLILKYLGAANLAWVDMAQAGALAVFVREVINQTITKQVKPLEESKTEAKPVDDAITVNAESYDELIKTVHPYQ